MHTRYPRKLKDLYKKINILCINTNFGFEEESIQTIMGADVLFIYLYTHT